ncbi:MAG: chromate efflux transporter [Chloroflexi bacterium]|nr:chromate efflux transporter [Chloroflexota bacterium]MCL5275980.1 chromate efflux transporter [Chloroflexota bacterium]
MSSSEPAAADMAAPSHKSRLLEVTGVFLRLGFTAFGGPAAAIAMMHQEMVQRRKWVSPQQFIDLLGIANVIPGPTSTELAIYLGYLRAGWLGLLLGGVCFITPAMLIVLALAWAYVAYGQLPQAAWLFYGIQPVVVAIIAQAIWNLGRVILKTNWAVAAGVAVVALYLLGVNVLALLFGAGLLIGVSRWLLLQKRVARGSVGAFFLPLAGAVAPGALAAAAAPFSLGLLFLTFLKVGSVVYGSGYVLLAFLRTDLVQGLGWLTDRQLLDAIAVGQFTPGPVFTTATFIGYVVGGLPGALLATVGIFLPSFVFVALIHPFAARLRRAPLTSAVLDGINIAALGLMAGVLLQLGQNALIDPITWVVALAALAILVRFRMNSVWLIIAGALIGMIRFALH